MQRSCIVSTNVAEQDAALGFPRGLLFTAIAAAAVGVSARLVLWQIPLFWFAGAGFCAHGSDLEWIVGNTAW